MYLYEDYGWRASLDLSIIQENEEKTRFTFAHTYNMTEGGIEQAGYIDIKQPPKVKGRKLKTWKKKWVVLHEMSIRSAAKAAVKPAAKVDVYADKKTAIASPSDKHTFILEFVSEVRPAKSKNREHAFEIVENEAVLVMSGESEFETQTWMSAFKKIFWPNQVECDEFTVTIIPNEHTRKLSLEGVYKIKITPEVIGIQSKTHNSYEWSLNMLKRFHLEKDAENPAEDVLTIECGPKSECGEATFQFRSDKVIDVLAAIKRNIVEAINLKKAERSSPKTHSPKIDKPWRTSVTSNVSNDSDLPRSVTSRGTEQHYRELLEDHEQIHEQETKRTRFISTNSDTSRCSSDQPSTPSVDVPEVATKTRHGVTFETPVELPEVKDLLSEPIEIAPTTEETEYNSLEFNRQKSPQAVGNIITTFTVAKPGYQTRVLLDEHGYSHVNMKNAIPVIEEEATADKMRSVSNISSNSSSSCRSASVGSRDSGILYQAEEKTNQPLRGMEGSRSSNSFDSAVSTSSVVEQNEKIGLVSNQTKLTIEIQEIVGSASEIRQVVNETDDSAYINDTGIYQDVSLVENNLDTTESNVNVKHSPIKKSNSTGNFKIEENHYEDLDKYRKGKKDLFKHLGMDPKVDPSSVPPSLPERPNSHKVKRKFHSNEKKMFTLPFARNRNRKSKDRAISETSSSDSDSDIVRESKKNRKGSISVKAWPLGNKSIMAENDELYQPVAIERFLNDTNGNSAPLIRERSSSLNLNVVPLLKKPSMRIDREIKEERKTAMWKHNRNVSMHMDLMNRKNDPDTTDMNLDLQQKFDMSLGPELLEENSGSSTAFSRVGMDIDNETTSDSVVMSVSDDEPIYAEVQPVCKTTNGIEEPFPDLDSWKPPVIEATFCDNSALDDTTYENDDSMNSTAKGTIEDIFNLGFVSDQESSCTSEQNVNGARVDNSNENILIDISTEDTRDIDAYSKRQAFTAADIFTKGFEPLINVTGVKTSTTQTTNLSILNQTTVDFVDIFNLGVFTPLPHSKSNLSNANVKPVGLTTISENENKTLGDEANWANFSHIDNKEVTDFGHESIYMDMSTCKNESIYVMPSSLKNQNDK